MKPLQPAIVLMISLFYFSFILLFAFCGNSKTWLKYAVNILKLTYSINTNIIYLLQFEGNYDDSTNIFDG